MPRLSKLPKWKPRCRRLRGREPPASPAFSLPCYSSQVKIYSSPKPQEEEKGFCPGILAREKCAQLPTAGLKGAPCGQAPCSEADDTGQPCCPASECVCHTGYVAIFGLHVGAEAFSVQSNVPLRLPGNRKGCPIFKPFSSANLLQLTLQQQRMTACHSSLI